MSFVSSRGGATCRGTGQFLGPGHQNTPLPPFTPPSPGKLYVAGDLADALSYANNTVLTQVGTANNWLTGSSINGVGIGSYHMIKSDNTLWAVGQNDLYQLGLGNTANVSSFTQVGSANNWAWCSMGSGDEGAFAITTTGNLYSWGYNDYASLGQSNLGKTLTSTWTSTYRANITTPTFVTSNVLKVVQMNNSTLILKDNGTIWGCGLNQQGQLGLGITDDTTNVYPSFTQETSYKNNWIDIAIGKEGFLALNAVGQIFYTGYNYTSNSLPQVNSFTQLSTTTSLAYMAPSQQSSSAAYIDTSNNIYGLGDSIAFGPGYGPWFPQNKTSWTSIGNTAIEIQLSQFSSVRKNSSNQLYAAGFPLPSMGIGSSGSSTPLTSLTKIGTTQTWQAYNFTAGWYISST